MYCFNGIYKMATIKNYNQQYAFAKNELTKAIKSGYNVVLLGSSGANGKTHLVKEMKELIIENDYILLEEPCLGHTNFVCETLSYYNKEKWIMTTNKIEHLQSSLKNNAFVLINMSQFKYPKYSKLRSGRA